MQMPPLAADLCGRQSSIQAEAGRTGFSKRPPGGPDSPPPTRGCARTTASSSALSTSSPQYRSPQAHNVRRYDPLNHRAPPPLSDRSCGELPVNCPRPSVSEARTPPRTRRSTPWRRRRDAVSPIEHTGRVVGTGVITRDAALAVSQCDTHDIFSSCGDAADAVNVEARHPT